MNLQKSTDLKKIEITPQLSYFNPAYLHSQHYPNIQLFHNESFFIPFSIETSKATSIAKSPFGSFLKLSEESVDSFRSFEKDVERSLKDDHLKELLIKHPSPIYSDFVDSLELLKVGYSTLYNDINQHIVLDENWEGRLHKMQSRKLKILNQEGFEFRRIPNSDIEVVHQFLTVCRQAQGLQINISLELLTTLSKLLTDTYDFFGVFRENKMSSVCICVRVTEEVAYYYLPGTSPLFRNQSPMVLLIAGMVEYYRNSGFKYFDLGASSYEGKPQETLRLFKERMGAGETMKPTFHKSLS